MSEQGTGNAFTLRPRAPLSLGMRNDARLAYSTDETTLCEICDERDYGSPCDRCLIEVMECCPHCLNNHAVAAQAECAVLPQDEVYNPKNTSEDVYE